MNKKEKVLNKLEVKEKKRKDKRVRKGRRKQQVYLEIGLSAHRVSSRMDMEDDPDYDIFRDEDEDPDAQLHTVSNYTYFIIFFLNLKIHSFIPSLQENDSNKEYVVYLVDASSKMFTTTCLSVCFSLPTMP